MRALGFAFLTAFLILAYGANATIDESNLSALTRELIASKRATPPTHESLSDNTVVGTFQPGSITLVYPHSSVPTIQALETLMMVAWWGDFSAKVTDSIKNGQHGWHVKNLLPSDPPLIDPDTAVMAFTRGYISILYHHEMGIKKVTEIVKNMAEDHDYLNTLDEYHIVGLYHSGANQYERIR